MLSRQEALDKLRAALTEGQLVQHSLAAEAVMRGLAKHLGEDQDLWGLAGLLHDLDYSQTATNTSRHGLDAVDMIGDALPPEALAAIRAHAAEWNGSTPETRFDYALRCGETVTGLVTTAALVRPTGMDGMEPKSLKKKMKDKAFAASVNRDTIRECEKIDMDLDTFLGIAIASMTEVAGDLGLKK